MRISDWSSDVCSSDLRQLLTRKSREVHQSKLRVNLHHRPPWLFNLLIWTRYHFPMRLTDRRDLIWSISYRLTSRLCCHIFAATFQTSAKLPCRPRERKSTRLNSSH